jgi:hypothetical protein
MTPAPAPSFRAVWPGDLRELPAQQRWLWTGYLAPGHLTLLTSLSKCGKTTLLASLLQRLGSGGTVAGQSVCPGKALVVSEETEEIWAERRKSFDFGTHVCFICQPFSGKPSPEEWQALLDHILKLHAEHQFALAAFDTLTELLPCRSENDAVQIQRALLPIRRLTAAGMAALLTHHPRKERSGIGQAARGSSVLTGKPDIGMEMHHWRPEDLDDRCRKLVALSRFKDTPRQRLIELDAAGTDYVSLGSLIEQEFSQHLDILLEVLADAADKLTQQQIRADWPVERCPQPSQPQLWRWLDQAVRQERVLRTGKGRRSDPYRYWLKNMEAIWAQQQEDSQWDPLRAILGDEWVQQQKLKKTVPESGDGNAKM